MERSAHKPKAEFDARASAEMREHLSKPAWNTRQTLALSCRMLAREEHGSALAGQITARGETPGTMWTARLQLLAMAAGTVRDLEPGPAKQAHDYRLKPEPLGATFHYFARQELRTAPDCID
jgi:hypothetical protein